MQHNIMPSRDIESSLADLPVHRLSALISSGQVSPVDIVDQCLARIAALEPRLGAFVEVYADDARLAAEAADKAIRSGHRIGPLHGIPIALKDLVEIEGRVATGGSAVYRNRVSQRTATLARRLIAAGMIVVGKTHTVEFAYGAWGTNQHLGTPWNPWDASEARTPGGSSSGSGVAVAARMVPCAIGTDTGGSVRIPAAWCGITGLKVTIGRISAHGVLPLSPTLDTPGPMTRSVEDAAMLLAVLQGADPQDPKTLLHRDIDPLRDLQRGAKGLRLGRLPDSERNGIDRELLTAYDQTLDTLTRLGAEIVEIKLPRTLREMASETLPIISAEGYALLADIVDDPGQPVDEAVRPRMLAGATFAARDYLRALARREQDKAAFAEAIRGLDAVLTPVTLTPPIRLSEVDQSQSPSMLTRWVNLLDLCGIAIPNGLTADGLPTSVQIVCRAADEATALRIGWALENATDWQARVPPMISDSFGAGAG